MSTVPTRVHFPPLVTYVLVGLTPGRHRECWHRARRQCDAVVAQWMTMRRVNDECAEQRRRRRQRARRHRHQSHRLRSAHPNEVVVETVRSTEYAAAGVECQKPNHDETTIKLTSIKLGNYGGQRCCFSQPGAYCASSPKLPQQPAKSETNKSQFKMTQRRKKAISKRPKEERKKEFKMKFKQDKRRIEKLAGTRYKLAMLEKKGRRTENH